MVGSGRNDWKYREIGESRSCRDHVAREGIADGPGAGRVRPGRARIVDGHGQRAEIAAPLGERGDRHQPLLGLPAVPVAVVRREEEHPAAPDRSPGGETELVLVVVGLRRREERLRIERLVAEVLEGAATELVRPGLDDVVRRALAVVHHGGAAGLHLELLDRLHGDAEREVAPFALHHRIGDRDAIDVGVVREVLSAHDVAPAADRLHAGHEEHEGGGIARAARVHHQRQGGVDLVANRLSQAGVRGRELRGLAGDHDLLRHTGDRERQVQPDDGQRIDDDAIADDGLEAHQGDRDAVGTRRERRQDVHASLRGLTGGDHLGREVGRGHGGPGQRGLRRVLDRALDGSAAAELCRDRSAGDQDRGDDQDTRQCVTLQSTHHLPPSLPSWLGESASGTARSQCPGRVGVVTPSETPRTCVSIWLWNGDDASVERGRRLARSGDQCFWMAIILAGVRASHAIDTAQERPRWGSNS